MLSKSEPSPSVTKTEKNPRCRLASRAAAISFSHQKKRRVRDINQNQQFPQRFSPFGAPVRRVCGLEVQEMRKEKKEKEKKAVMKHLCTNAGEPEPYGRSGVGTAAESLCRRRANGQ